MKFDQKNEFVQRARKRAKYVGCTGCQRKAEVGIKTVKSLTAMVRAGASMSEIKAAIREHGWYCRKCVRRFQGSSATTTCLRDQFPPGEAGTREYNRHRFELNKDWAIDNGYVAAWDEAAGDFTLKPVSI